MEFLITKIILQRGLAFIYLMGFVIAFNQYLGLVGSNGILPLKNFIPFIRFKDAPSLFFLNYSDRFLKSMSLLGILLSLFALSGCSEKYGFFVSIATWLLLWVIYQSFVNVGQIFYSYGWEILLLECGFLAIFLGPDSVSPSPLLIFLYRWLLFRLMFGAGLIKIRADCCWKNLTALIYHYETQPLPGPMSRLFHRMPIFMHKLGVLFNHFVELIVPFFLFWPNEIAVWAGFITIIFQFILILSGNLSWLNYLTIVICFSCLNDAFIKNFIQVNPSSEVFVTGNFYHIVVFILTGLVAYLSIKPIRNLFSHNQAMNRSFDSLHLVNTYGAFGTVTRKRLEIILEGTEDRELSDNTIWKEYEFKAKPGRENKKLPLVSPYHYKIDWQMWFAAMSSPQFHPWFFPFVEKILEGNQAVLELLKINPFKDHPPKFLRAKLYEYHFAHPNENKVWNRKFIGDYLLPIFLKSSF